MISDLQEMALILSVLPDALPLGEYLARLLAPAESPRGDSAGGALDSAAPRGDDGVRGSVAGRTSASVRRVARLSRTAAVQARGQLLLCYCVH